MWYAPEGLELKPGDLRELFQDIDQGRIRVIPDPLSPFPFTEEGVRHAMALQKSTHAHGKVVIKIADE
jgi:NADPH:quinone reductase-like Zn-dependent oxidoreductase